MTDLPGKYFRTAEGSVARPYVTRSGDADLVAEARGVRRLYRLAWQQPDGKELRGSQFYTLEELLEIPRSRWTTTRPRKIS